MMAEAMWRLMFVTNRAQVKTCTFVQFTVGSGRDTRAKIHLRARKGAPLLSLPAVLQAMTSMAR
jgi:hypothetical protein